jgi:hypothetical protein
MPEFPPLPEPGTDPNDAILMWETRGLAIDAFWQNEEHDQSDEFVDRLGVLERDCWHGIAALPADTFAALATKVRILVREVGQASSPDYCGQCVDTLLDDIERLDGTPPIRRNIDMKAEAKMMPVDELRKAGHLCAWTGAPISLLCRMSAGPSWRSIRRSSAAI